MWLAPLLLFKRERFQPGSFLPPCPSFALLKYVLAEREGVLLVEPLHKDLPGLQRHFGPFEAIDTKPGITKLFMVKDKSLNSFLHPGAHGLVEDEGADLFFES